MWSVIGNGEEYLALNLLSTWDMDLLSTSLVARGLTYWRSFTTYRSYDRCRTLETQLQSEERSPPTNGWTCDPSENTGAPHERR
jgi:hypothetical protein